MKMEFIKPLLLVDNAIWDSRHLGVLDLDETIEEVGDVVERTGGEPEEPVDNVGFDWRSISQRHWNPAAGENIATIYRYDPAHYRIQWSVENGIQGDAILFEVMGPGTDPDHGISHRTHMEVVENAAGLAPVTSLLETVWLPGFNGSSFQDVVDQLKVRVLGIYNPQGNVSVRLTITLLGGMMVQEAESWSVPKLVLKREKKAVPSSVTNPYQATVTEDIIEAGDADPVVAELQSLMQPMSSDEE
jgi:hypothetical protein